MNTIKEYRIQGETVLLIRDWLSIGKTLRDLRLEKNLTQTKAARLFGMTQATLNHFENGLSFPSVPRFMQMAKVLGFTRIVIEIPSEAKDE